MTKTAATASCRSGRWRSHEHRMLRHGRGRSGAERYRCPAGEAARGLNLELVEGLPQPCYGFDPDGWMLFRVRADSHTRGPAEYVAVRRDTGEVHFLGPLGQ